MRMPPHRAPAQVMVLFGLSLIGIMALLTLVLDGSTIYLQRRTAQNAADAAALAGTRTLQYTTNASLPSNAIAVSICTYLQANAFGYVPSGSAYLVDGSGNYLRSVDLTNDIGGAPCVGNPGNTDPTGAGGVHVDASITFNTYILGTVQRLLKVGGMDTMTARAGATAHVWDQSLSGNQLAPFATCGAHAPVDTSGDGSPSGTLVDLFLPGTTTINPALYGTKTIVLEDSQINAGSAGWLKNYGPPACPDDNGSSWKGVANPTSTVTLPADIPTVNGNGQSKSDVATPCSKTNQPDPSTGTCYLWVPVTDGNNSKGTAHVVVLACMQMIDIGNDPKWEGTLESPAFCPYTPFQPNWQWTASGSGANTRVALTN